MGVSIYLYSYICFINRHQFTYMPSFWLYVSVSECRLFYLVPFYVWVHSMKLSSIFVSFPVVFVSILVFIVSMVFLHIYLSYSYAFHLDISFSLTLSTEKLRSLFNSFVFYFHLHISCIFQFLLILRNYTSFLFSFHPRVSAGYPKQ